MADEIVNKIASSALVQLNLDDYYPIEEVVIFDLQPHLFMGLILKEKEFRDALQKVEWEQYRSKVVGVTCSADAIIPSWAYMLVASYLQPYAIDVMFGNQEEVVRQLFTRNIQAIDASEFSEQRVVVKGCSDKVTGEYVFLEITKKLRPVVKSLMFGEPCSTVPVYKAKKSG